MRISDWSSDVCSSDLTCAQAVQTAIDAFGRLDVLCNIAGILRFHALPDVTPEDWNRLIATNLTAPFFMMPAAMPHLIETQGNVVNNASTDRKRQRLKSSH